MNNLRRLKTVKQRRGVLEKELEITLANIGCYSLDEKIANHRNCENMIGVAQVPMGVAGPLRLRSGQAIKNYYLPLATTEGALVASVNRGCRAITEAGGANVFMEKIGITRGPVFKTKSLAESFKLKEWLISNLSNLSNLSEKTSGHLKLLKIEPQVLGKNIYVRFYFDTQEAMGMNMVTMATSAIVQMVEQETGTKCLSLSGNFCVDKKPSWSNFILGRGRKVWAEATISQETVKKVLKTVPEKIYKVWLNKCMLGSAISGSMGFNSHFANIIAAIFAATGQDLAHVTEGSLGITTVEILNDIKRAEVARQQFLSESNRERPSLRIPQKLGGLPALQQNNLYISVYLPDLIVGTVGGGTGLATQQEALSIIFGKEKPSVDKLAEVIGGAVLAGELSLLASLAEGSLAQAHQKLGRGKRA